MDATVQEDTIAHHISKMFCDGVGRVIGFFQIACIPSAKRENTLGKNIHTTGAGDIPSHICTQTHTHTYIS